ncbi:hypothetical protein HYC85_009248 [Camellia sinensis]|uniref:Phosphomannomutase n=1 Tax=Camellia sinensis TaxID=4442 RepID=A0A7J7HH48_CAMSI|nr:hypothetical protein HYC85_009248 [Camellia sinensis]
MAVRKPRLIALFDVDGTLTTHPKCCCPDFWTFARARSWSLEQELSSCLVGRARVASLERAIVSGSGPQSCISWLEREFLRSSGLVCSSLEREVGRSSVLLVADLRVVTSDMLKFLQELRKVVTVGVVGGSDLVKISEQLGNSVINDYDYVFAENGLVAYKDGKLIGTQSLRSYLGEEKLKEFINFTLYYIADLDIPIKRGTFIEFRSGMLNVCAARKNGTSLNSDADVSAEVPRVLVVTPR